MADDEKQEDEKSRDDEEDDAAEERERAAAELEEAQDNLKEAEQYEKDIEAWRQRIKKMQEEMEQRHAAIRQMEAAAEAGEAKLLQADDALNKYLDGNPAAREAREFLEFKPRAGQLVTPKDLDSRLNLSPGARKELARFMCDTDPAVRRNVDSMARKLHEAKLPMESAKALKQISITLSGRLAEEMVTRALGCYGESVSTQTRKDLPDGKHFTKVDLVVDKLKNPILLGRGENMFVPAGGSLALEIKCGRKAYLRQQREHMCNQAYGHRDFSASFTLCSRDIHNLGKEAERDLRERLREAGSPLIGQLPYKDEMDEVCINLVRERERELYGNE